MKLSKKLSSGFSLILIILIFTSGFAFYNFTKTNNQVKSIRSTTIPHLINSEYLSKNTLIALNLEKDFLLARSATDRENTIAELNRSTLKLKQWISEQKNQNNLESSALLQEISNFETLYQKLSEQLGARDNLNDKLYETNDRLIKILAEYSAQRDEFLSYQLNALNELHNLQELYKTMKLTTSQLLNNPTMDKNKLLAQARKEQMKLRSNTSKVENYLKKASDLTLADNLKDAIKVYSRTLKQFVTAYTAPAKDSKKIEQAKNNASKAEDEVDKLINNLYEIQDKDIGTSKSAITAITRLEYLLPETQIINLGYQISQNKENLNKLVATVDKSLKNAEELSNHTMNQKDTATVADIIQGIKLYQKQFQDWKILNDSISTDTSIALNAAIANILKQTGSTVDHNTDLTFQTIDNIVSNSEQAMTLIIITSLCGLIIGIVLAVVLIRTIVKPVIFVTMAMDIISDKVQSITNIMYDKLAVNNWSEELIINETDPDVRRQALIYARRPDEIGQAVSSQIAISESVRKASEAINQVIEDVNGVLSEVVQTVANVATSSHHLESASKELADGATRQASSLDEITASLTDMNRQVEQNANGASKARDLSIEATDAGSKGNEKMKILVAKMNEINSATGEITKIIKTIDDIAFQTNLLALNAAVEAARAGQHGKGFAVVAEEVRNLAARSAKAAGETGSLIENVVKQINSGNTMVGDTASVLAEIVGYSQEVTDLSSTVAAASSEQSERVSEINTALDQVDGITQRNAASAEETASSSQELNFYADNLEKLTCRFILKPSEQEEYSAAADLTEPEDDPAQITLVTKPAIRLPVNTQDRAQNESDWGR